VILLTLEELLVVAERALGQAPVVRDIGLLESAVARPRATAFGADAYASLEERAAAFVHSLVRNHALIDGNKRLGLSGLIVLLGVNGRRLTWTNDEAYEFIVEIAEGRLDDVPAIADRIVRGSTARSRR
jgi:death-on-curing protein